MFVEIKKLSLSLALMLGVLFPVCDAAGNPTEGNDIIFFSGTLGQITQNLVNPYSGFEILIDDEFNINTTSYDGLGGEDILIGTGLGDYLNIRELGFTDPVVQNIEFFIAGDGGDVIQLADTSFTLGDIDINGGAGDDILWANIGDDLIRGATGNDILDGGPGHDELLGVNDNDTLIGGDGDDILDGGADDDILIGGPGIDVYIAGQGLDTIIEAPAAELNSIELPDGVLFSDLVFTESGQDLDITVGILGGITIVDQFLSSDHGIDTLVFSDSSTFDLRTLPEPASIAFLALGGLAVVRRRR